LPVWHPRECAEPVAGETPLLKTFMGEDTPEIRAKFCPRFIAFFHSDMRSSSGLHAMMPA
jgi:hypothetical protein